VSSAFLAAEPPLSHANRAALKLHLRQADLAQLDLAFPPSRRKTRLETL
jgi:hypothetical protein